jgi:hypothetical protein
MLCGRSKGDQIPERGASAGRPDVYQETSAAKQSHPIFDCHQTQMLLWRQVLHSYRHLDPNELDREPVYFMIQLSKFACPFRVVELR